MIFKFLYPFLLITFFPTHIIFAQLSLRLNLEGGYYQSASELQGEADQSDATFRIDGEIGYKYEVNKRVLSFKLRGRPEIYGLNNNLNILKLKGIASYYLPGEKINWAFSITGQRNDYSGNNIDLDFQDYIFMLESSLKLNNIFSFSGSMGYGNQKISNDVNQKMDLFFIDLKLLQRVFGNANLGYGIYAERFILSNLYLSENANNSGWRIGPHLSFDYLKRLLVNIDYRFLFHISEVTASPSYEHWIRFVAGKLLTERWSLFILTDYYFRKYTINKNLNNPYVSLYTPINEDNRIYLKLAFTLFTNFEIYLKAGYFRENLYNAYSFAGWNALIGFEIEN